MMRRLHLVSGCTPARNRFDPVIEGARHVSFASPSDSSQENAPANARSCRFGVFPLECDVSNEGVATSPSNALSHFKGSLSVA